MSPLLAVRFPMTNLIFTEDNTRRDETRRENSEQMIKSTERRFVFHFARTDNSYVQFYILCPILLKTERTAHPFSIHLSLNFSFLKKEPFSFAFNVPHFIRK